MLPSFRLISMVTAAAPLFLAGALIDAFTGLGVIYLILLIVYISIDIAILPRKKHIRISRKVPARISLGCPTLIEIEIENLSRRSIQLSLAEDVPDSVTIEPNQVDVKIQPKSRITAEYKLTASKRGSHTIERMFVRILPSMGLLHRQFQYKEPVNLEVFPNLVNIEKYELQAKRGLTLQTGLARLRRIGQGAEFESLRNYVPGDELSRIDWKATAKRQDLIVRNYEPERQQNVLVAIDTGRATAGEFEGISRLDYLVNAALMLAYVTLRQKDLFSLIAFSDRVEAYLPPVNGIKNIDRVAQSLFDLDGKLVESDYGAACRFIGTRNRKRSFLCMMTDVTGIDANSVVIAYMKRFARQHLPLAITLKNPQIDEIADQPLSNCNDPYSKAVAIDMINSRKEALQLMRQNGVGILDTLPQKLTPQLIERYLTIKFQNKL